MNILNQYDLSRYVTAQQRDYQSALTEIKNGKKVSHWMWYIFPQIRGLGKSSTSQFYAIQSLNEARAFLEHPYLGHNIIEISEALLSLDTSDAYEVFGKPDNMKLKSSMTLFARASEDDQVFLNVLDKYFKGKRDFRTLKILENMEK